MAQSSLSSSVWLSSPPWTTIEHKLSTRFLLWTHLIFFFFFFWTHLIFIILWAREKWSTFICDQHNNFDSRFSLVYAWPRPRVEFPAYIQGTSSGLKLDIIWSVGFGYNLESAQYSDLDNFLLFFEYFLSIFYVPNILVNKTLVNFVLSWMTFAWSARR